MKTQPNIIVILSDDMGFSDLGCYGGEIQTPNLDGLAQNGVRFTQFYNMARCCPTRASLLTGLYPHQAGVGHMTDDKGFDGYKGTLNQECVTLAEVLQGAGYRTYMAGKWHVTRHVGPSGDKSGWPLQRGFEKFYGTINGAGSFYDPTSLCRQNTYITPENDPEYRPRTFYYTNALSDNAVRFLQQHQQESKEKPFFLYLAYTAAHWPMHALEQDIAKYRGKYREGYEAIRAARFERLKALGLIRKDEKLSPAPEPWRDVKNKAWEERCMEVYAAMVECMDAGIGRLVAQLKASGQWENTLLFFLQDNGGCAEGMGRRDNTPAPSDLKPFSRDTLQPQIWPPMQTRDGRGVRTGPQVMPGPPDTYVAYGRAWANVSNTPFREYKHDTYEGGISTPLIAHWPVGIPRERRGKREAQPGHLVDIMATLVDVAGARYPGGKIKPLEGVSLRPAFSGKPLGRRSPLFWEHEGNRAVREGRWKLVAKENQPWELYDIDTDRSEQTNLAKKEPGRVQRLAAAWDAYAARANVLPLGAWRGPQAIKPSTATLFTLKSGESREGSQAPAIAGKTITITAQFQSKPDTQGVVVAQGGATNGYSLFIQEGKLHLATKVEGTRTMASLPLTPGAHVATATLTPVGELKLVLDGATALAKAPKGLGKQPLDGLNAGSDAGGAVGPYRAPFAFTGTIVSLEVRL